eukprot:1181405-Prorocentrum_minimum.AAC.2
MDAEGPVGETRGRGGTFADVSGGFSSRVAQEVRSLAGRSCACRRSLERRPFGRTFRSGRGTRV